jgi:hypothetical protein
MQRLVLPADYNAKLSCQTDRRTHTLSEFIYKIHLVGPSMTELDLPNTKWVTKVKLNVNSVEVHLLLTYNGHIVGGPLFTLDQPVRAVPFENLFN